MTQWQSMWSLAFFIYVVCKTVTWWDAGHPLTLRGLGYLAAWPGLDSRGFLSDKPVSPPSEQEWAFALAKTFVGAVIFNEGAKGLLPDYDYLAGWIGMVGIVMTLHFGVFHLLSCAWRSIGVDAKPLMNWPIFATGLRNFWGERWNTAFRDMTNRFFYQPLILRLRSLGPRRISVAILLSYVFSGVVHDLVISVPAGGGYGGPTLFFLIQAVGCLLEVKCRKRGWTKGWRGRLYAAGFLILPAPFLFHGPFVRNIIVPFMEAAGAI